MKHLMSNKAQIVLVISMILSVLVLNNIMDSKAKASRKTIIAQQEQDCEQAVLLFADEGTDMYLEHMELCTKYDPDYLTPLIEEQEHESL